MTDNPENAATENQKKNDLHPFYEPAEVDSMVTIRFVGNTSQVADVKFRNCDPFQLKGAAWWLERHADKTLTLSERKAAAEGLSKPEDEGGPSKPRIMRPGDLRG